MDETDIVNQLRGLTLAEPELGFDPDETTERAARRLRNRRATIGTMLAVAALAAAAVAVSTTDLTGAQPANPGPPATEFLPPQPDPTDGHDLSAVAARNQEHLSQVIKKVLPNADQIDVGDFVQYNRYDEKYWRDIRSRIEFRDDAGPAMFFLWVSGQELWGNPATLCEPNGQRLRCDMTTRPDGSRLNVRETGDRVNAIYVSLFRPDGTVVSVSSGDWVFGDTAERYGQKNPDGTGHAGTRSRSALTEQQMIALVTDPAFTLK